MTSLSEIIERVSQALDQLVADEVIPGWSAAVDLDGSRGTASGGTHAAEPPSFRTLGGGLISTPADNCTFLTALRHAAGRFGWSGGTGCQAYADPGHRVTGVVCTNRPMDSAEGHPAFIPFWDAVYASPLPTT